MANTIMAEEIITPTEWSDEEEQDWLFVIFSDEGEEQEDG